MLDELGYFRTPSNLRLYLQQIIVPIKMTGFEPWIADESVPDLKMSSMIVNCNSRVIM